MLVLLLAGATAFGATPLNWKSEGPYRVTVGLKFSSDPVFTRFFTESIRCQVRDQLRNFFGALAEFEVDTRHPLAETLTAAGLTDLELEPEQFDRQGIAGKVFLFFVAFGGGTYQISWRQLDGDVQYVGPLYRRETADRQWLGKSICLAVKRDFAPLALVEPVGPAGPVKPGTSRRVRLTFRGVEGSPRLGEASLLQKVWLADRCVLQVFRLLRQADGSYRAQLLPHTVLTIDDPQKPHRATVVSSLADPLRRQARVAGFLARKLTTQKGRFRLRLVDSQEGLPVLDASVLAGSEGFGALGDRDRLPPPDRHGYVTADRDFDRLAYVVIERDSAYQLLLPITGDRCEQICRLPVREGVYQRKLWQRRLRYCLEDIQVMQTMIDDYFCEINRLNEHKRYEKALQVTRDAREALRPLVGQSDASIGWLQAEAARLQLNGSSRLDWAVGQIETLRRRVGQLRTLAADLGHAIDKIDAQNRARVLVHLAAEAEEAGRIEEAIKTYEGALKEWSDLPKVRARLTTLQQVWKIKSPAHAAARKFTYETWANARVQDISGLMPQLEQHLGVLRTLRDWLTARKMAVVCDRHLRELGEVVRIYEGRTDPASRRDFDAYAQLAERLARFRVDQIGDFPTPDRRPGAGAAGPTARGDRLAAPATPPSDALRLDEEE